MELTASVYKVQRYKMHRNFTMKSFNDTLIVSIFSVNIFLKTSFVPASAS